MDTTRRNLLKHSPLAIVSAATTIGHSALAETSAAAATDAIFNVRTYGATGDGKTIDTPAINRAIEAVAATGGGMLVFPSGTYVAWSG